MRKMHIGGGGVCVWVVLIDFMSSNYNDIVGLLVVSPYFKIKFKFVFQLICFREGFWHPVFDFISFICFVEKISVGNRYLYTNKIRTKVANVIRLALPESVPGVESKTILICAQIKPYMHASVGFRVDGQTKAKGSIFAMIVWCWSTYRDGKTFPLGQAYWAFHQSWPYWPQ